MLRRFLFLIPVLLLFVLTTCVFLAAHAPRTWAQHWTTPTFVASGAGEGEYGAAHGAEGWSIAWVDDDLGRLMLTRPGGQSRSIALDHGEVRYPTLLKIGNYEMAAWVHNKNGGTELRAALIGKDKNIRVLRLVDSPNPIEHPFLFHGAGNTFGLVFSWQKRGNYETFLTTVAFGSSRASPPRRLNSAELYSFYPRAAVSRNGTLGLLYLDNCCKQQTWNVVFHRYDAHGRSLGAPQVLYRIQSYGRGRQMPDQWGMDVQSDSSGSIWGAFTGDAGMWVFHTDATGRIQRRPRLLDAQEGAPPALTIIPKRSGGYLMWEQHYDLGSYVSGQRFDGSIQAVGRPERAVYGSGSQTNPHASLVAGVPEVVWQTVTRGIGSKFEVAQYRGRVEPSVAQRLGLGLGDPWQTLAVLIIGALGVATLTTTGNLLLVIVLGFLGLVEVKLLRKVRERWLIYACLLTLALYFSFVVPGGPILFLDTMPSMGLSAMPFGFLAALGALGFVFWTGTIGLRRIDDLYRAGIMAFLGVYFFAFLEAAVFIQQRLGYI